MLAQNFCCDLTVSLSGCMLVFQDQVQGCQTVLRLANVVKNHRFTNNLHTFCQYFQCQNFAILKYELAALAKQTVLNYLLNEYTNFTEKI